MVIMMNMIKYRAVYVPSPNNAPYHVKGAFTERLAVTIALLA